MKKIPQPELKTAVELTAAQMNAIHFGGNHTPLTPSQLAALAAKQTRPKGKNHSDISDK